MLILKSLSLAYSDRPLFSGLDLTIDRGQLVGISGESGCGKTSLLRAILGLVPITEGSIEVDGLPLTPEHITEIRQRTAYVPQELQPPAENGAALIALTHTLSHNRSLVALPEGGNSSLSALFAALGLEESLLTLDAAKLSGGQRQRILLAAALALPKPLLLLDEPTSALDEESTQRVALALLHACHDEGRSALVVSHDPVLLRFCDKQVTLGNVLS